MFLFKKPSTFKHASLLIQNKTRIRAFSSRHNLTGSNFNESHVVQTQGSTTVSVKAYYIARRIDLIKANSSVYGTLKNSKQERKSVTIEIDKSLNQYVSIFSYGSIVLFNVPEALHLEHLRRIESAIVTPLTTGTMEYKEDYKIIINPQLDYQSVIKAEYVNIRSLDHNNIAIVGTVIAQSVALDYYAESVDKMLETFMKMNLNIEKSGNFSDLKPKGLYQLVAFNNRVFATVLSKLGIFEGSDAAWDNADYHDTFEGLRKDFEIEYRYKDLSLKLDIVRDNSHFFLEMLHNQKATFLEWTIIILIAVEIVIGISGLLLPLITSSTATATATSAAVGSVPR